MGEGARETEGGSSTPGTKPTGSSVDNPAKPTLQPTGGVQVSEACIHRLEAAVSRFMDSRARPLPGDEADAGMGRASLQGRHSVRHPTGVPAPQSTATVSEEGGAALRAADMIERCSCRSCGCMAGVYLDCSPWLCVLCNVGGVADRKAWANGVKRYALKRCKRWQHDWLVAPCNAARRASHVRVDVWTGRMQSAGTCRAVRQAAGPVIQAACRLKVTVNRDEAELGTWQWNGPSVLAMTVTQGRSRDGSSSRNRATEYAAMTGTPWGHAPPTL
ncbi:hypothetical protein CGC21_28930 [Leishmania donovani]|uniref:Uncharacterized protein n=1 Tax=Leishmania donovani TaxID=5661 RepID=A0A504XWD9_LEIDO|nr:hypothetical protein CGC21_28930 [Leishmania donovani]